MSMLDMLRMREVVDEVVTFANAAAEASQLPGGQFGPRDAFRHIVGSAELTRRLGFWPARAVTEFNETQSWVFEQRRLLQGRPVPPALTADSRTMDRANNAIGQGIGLNAASPDAILEAARQQIERAWQLGAGTTGGADWLPPARWTEPNLGTEEGKNWPPRQWPDLSADPRVRAYPGHDIRSDGHGVPANDQAPGGPVHVRPHMREGHPVSGYTRAAPRH